MRGHPAGHRRITVDRFTRSFPRWGVPWSALSAGSLAAGRGKTGESDFTGRPVSAVRSAGAAGPARWVARAGAAGDSVTPLVESSPAVVFCRSGLSASVAVRAPARPACGDGDAVD